MLATIRDDTWNVLNMQPITANSKRWDYSDIPCGGHAKIKDPPTWLKVATTLENPPNPHPQNFQELLPLKKWCKRSKDMVTEVKTQFSRFQTITPFSSLIWWCNDAQSLIWHRRGAPLSFKVRSHGKKITNFDPNWAFLDCNLSLNSPMAIKWCTKLEVA